MKKLLLLIITFTLLSCTKEEATTGVELVGKGNPNALSYDPTTIEFTAPVATPAADRTISPTTTFIFSYKLHVGTAPIRKYRADNIDYIEIAVYNPTPTNCCLQLLKTRSNPTGWAMGDYTFTDTITLPRVDYYNNQNAGVFNFDPNYIWDGVVLTAHSSLTNGFADRNLFVGTPR